jgi:small multidrug resistance pump|tara:strand:+ start:2007 stop:2189 length:183 start_codon:yes stop_codon:yes gene_type:complete
LRAVALEISVAYAVWSAVVMAALAAVGMAFLGESVSIAKMLGILSIIVGTITLSMAGVEG